jgi:hypothetical protein
MSAPQKTAAGVAAPLSALAGGDVAESSPTVVARRHGHRDYVMRRLLVAADLTAIVLALAVMAAVDP